MTRFVIFLFLPMIFGPPSMTIDPHPTACRYFGKDRLVGGIGGGGIVKEKIESRTVDKVISPIFVFHLHPRYSCHGKRFI
jgi:hypothetical protein